MENYDKFRRLQQAFEEKSKSEQEARHLMRIAVQKNTQQESVIEDLQIALQKVRKEVPEIVSDKEQALKELDSRKSSYQRELAHLEDERDRYCDKDLRGGELINWRKKNSQIILLIFCCGLFSHYF